jgi:hypothetical protein
MEMRARTRKRVMRIILAALLESDLTTDEIQEFLGALFSNPALIFDLGDALGSLLQYFERRPTEKIRDWRTSVTTDEEKVYGELQRRRMSKLAVMRMMNKFSDAWEKQPISSTTTLRELVHLFWKGASATERKEFAEALAAPRGKDPYLEGIISRRQGASS